MNRISVISSVRNIIVRSGDFVPLTRIGVPLSANGVPLDTPVDSNFFYPPIANLTAVTFSAGVEYSFDGLVWSSVGFTWLTATHSRMKLRITSHATLYLTAVTASVLEGGIVNTDYNFVVTTETDPAAIAQTMIFQDGDQAIFQDGDQVEL